MGGYHKLSEGHPINALSDLTGFPSITIDLTLEKDTLINPQYDYFKLLQSYQNENLLLNVLTPGKIRTYDVLEKPSTFLPGYLYPILEVREVYGHKLVHIRNPYGGFEWDGAWGRKSSYWTNDMIELLKPNLETNDGTSWMSFEDFIKHFCAFNVLKTNAQSVIRYKGQFIKDLNT